MQSTIGNQQPWATSFLVHNGPKKGCLFEESHVNFKREKYMLYDNRDFFKHLFCPLALRDAVLTQNGSFVTVKSAIFIKSGCGLLNIKIRNNVDISKVPTELML